MGAAVAITKTIKKKAEQILQGKSKPEEIRAELKDIIDLDIEELQTLERDIQNLRRQQAKKEEIEKIDDLITLCKKVFDKAKEAIQTYPKRQDQLKELLDDIITLERIELVKLIKIKEGQGELRTDFERLLAAKDLEEEEATSFLTRIRGLLAKNAVKKIENALKKKIVKEKSYPPGPIITDKDLQKLAKSINDFMIGDLLVKYTLAGQTITFSLYGSLITGYSNNPKKLGKPSDFEGTSDVDILVALDNNVFENLFANLPERALFDKQGMQTTAPMGRDTKIGTEFAGPFQEIFKYLQGINLAGRPDRPIHLVFTNKTTWAKREELHKLALELKKDNPDIHLIDVNMQRIICTITI